MPLCPQRPSGQQGCAQGQAQNVGARLQNPQPEGPDHALARLTLITYREGLEEVLPQHHGGLLSLGNLQPQGFYPLTFIMLARPNVQH